MGKYRLLIIHCAATREGQYFDSLDVVKWHLAPKDLKDGRVRYNGRTYKSRQHLPTYNFHDINVLDDVGRGWSRVGYTGVITLDGNIEFIIDHSEDGWIDDNEVTYGVKGINSISKHICYIGGVDKYMQPKNTMTWQQEIALITFIKKELYRYPNLQVAGHNQFANKACPSFDTVDFLRLYNIPEHNIYHK